MATASVGVPPPTSSSPCCAAITAPGARRGRACLGAVVGGVAHRHVPDLAAGEGDRPRPPGDVPAAAGARRGRATVARRRGDPGRRPRRPAWRPAAIAGRTGPSCSTSSPHGRRRPPYGHRRTAPRSGRARRDRRRRRPAGDVGGADRARHRAPRDARRAADPRGTQRDGPCCAPTPRWPTPTSWPRWPPPTGAPAAALAAVAVGRRHLPDGRSPRRRHGDHAEVHRTAAPHRDRRGHAGDRPGPAAARRAGHGQDVGQRAPRRGDQRRLDAARAGHRRHHRGVAALRLELRPPARRGSDRGGARAEPGVPGDARGRWSASRS